MIINAKRPITIVSAVILAVIISSAGYPQAYEASKPCLCKGNPKLKKMIYAGKVKYVVDGYANDWEDWSTSMLKPDGAPPKKLPREQDEFGTSLDKYDRWSCTYSASKVVDNDPATAWAEGAEGDGIGEIVIVKIKSNQPLAIWAGLGASQSLYKANNRPRRVRVYVLQADPVSAYDLNQSGMTHRNLQVVGKHEVELKDVNGYQPLPLPTHTFKKGEGHVFIAIEILSVYRGNKYRDTCISEVRIDIDTKNSTSKIMPLIQKQKREAVFRASWGSGPGQLGRKRNNAYSYQVPLGFSVDDSGKVFILDQVNARVQVFDAGGKYRKAIRIQNSVYYEDIERGNPGRLFLLYKDFDQAAYKRIDSIVMIDESGKELKRIGLLGKGIKNASEAHSIYLSRDGLWTDVNGNRVRLCDASGNESNDRLILKLAGRMSSDEKYLFNVTGWKGTLLKFERRMTGRAGVDTYIVDFKIPISCGGIIDTDNKGNIYASTSHFVEENGPPYGIDDNYRIIVVLDSDGREKKRFYHAVSVYGLGNHREYRITPEGAIYHLVLDNDGAVMWRYIP